jgi:phage terminase large subunit-like protein
MGESRQVVLRLRPQAHQVVPVGDWHTLVILAGRGAGKTWRGCSWLLTQALSYPGTTWAAVAQTWGDAERILALGEGGLQWLIEGDEGNDVEDRRRPDLSFVLDGGSWDKAFRASPGRMSLRLANGSEIRFASADRPKSLRGGNYHGALCDEVAFWDREALHMVRLATRLGLPDGTPARLVMATTPNGVNWWSEEWLDRAPMDGVRYVAGVDGGRLPPDPPPSSLTNRHTDPAWRAALIAMYEGTDLYEQEVLGRVLSAAGAVFKELSPIRHTRAGLDDIGAVWPTPDTADEVLAGLDLGAENPSAVVVWARKGDRWHAVAEAVAPCATPEAVRDLIGTVTAVWPVRRIISDTNFPQTLRSLQQWGLPVEGADKSSGSVVDGIRAVQSLIGTDRLAVDVDACPVLWRDLRGYRWAVAPDGKPLSPERPVKRDDHTVDASRYLLHKVSGGKRRLLFS